MVTRDIIVNGSMLIEISIMSHIIIEISIEWHNNQYGHMSRHCAEQGFQALDTPNLITKLVAQDYAILLHHKALLHAPTNSCLAVVFLHNSTFVTCSMQGLVAYTFLRITAYHQCYIGILHHPKLSLHAPSQTAVLQ